MQIQEFIKTAISLEPIQKLIQATWMEFQKEHKWPVKPPKLGKNTLTKVIRGQTLIEETCGEAPKGYSLKDNIRKIGSNWNWTRNQAPIQLLESEKSWRALAANATITCQELEASNDEALQGANRWAKNQFLARKGEWNFHEKGEKNKILENILREIEEAAKALGKLEDLQPKQIQTWKQYLKNLAQEEI